MKRCYWGMTALMVVCVASVALADTIYFKSGMRLDVPKTIVRDGKVYYEMYGAQTSALMSDIEKIEKGELPQVPEKEVIVIDGDELKKKRRAEAAAKRAAQRAEAEKKERAKVYNSAWSGKVRQVDQWLKNRLKDPDSLKYIEWSKVVDLEDGFLVRCKYRAKNSFGGYVISHQYFKLNTGGKVVSVQDVNE